MEKFEVAADGVSDARESVSQALVGYLGRLDQTRRQRITGALRNEQIRRDFASYVVLAEAAPELLPEEATTDALIASLDAR